jgi:glycosyltransferase involved in cell wall biosynthesis
VKILFLIRSLEVGGAERQLVNLARTLSAQGHAIGVAVFRSGGELAAGLEGSGVRVHDLQKRGRWDLFGFVGQLVRLVRKERPDILHGYLVTANLLTLVCKAFVPGLKVVWGVRASDMNLARYDWLARVEFWLSRVAARWADLIVSNSTAGQDWHIAQGYPAERLRMIPNGIDTSRFHEDRAARRIQRAEWGVANEESLVGLIGRLDPMKDHANFLHAAALAQREAGDMRFVCIGDGPADYRARLEDLSTALGIGERVIWVRHCASMVAAYNALDVGVNASAFGEGFSNAIAEAMACGVPIAATSVGDNARLVGDAGRVVPPSDSKALAQAILWVLAQRASLAACGRDRIAGAYSVERLAHNTLAELESLKC